jgi:predicted DNA-binding protein (MmcQ/YjbR family)
LNKNVSHYGIKRSELYEVLDLFNLHIMNIDFLQQLTEKWPGVTTDIKWGNDLVFSVAAKMFCVCSLDAPFRASLKVKDEEFEELSVRDGFQPAPYMARNKWVLITNPGRLSKKEWEDFVKQSYELVKAKLPKKLQEELKEDNTRGNALPKKAHGTTVRAKEQRTSKKTAGRKQTKK